MDQQPHSKNERVSDQTAKEKGRKYRPVPMPKPAPQPKDYEDIEY